VKISKSRWGREASSLFLCWFKKQTDNKHKVFTGSAPSWKVEKGQKGAGIPAPFCSAKLFGAILRGAKYYGNIIYFSLSQK
jgi:hypothetical protein